MIHPHVEIPGRQHSGTEPTAPSVGRTQPRGSSQVVSCPELPLVRCSCSCFQATATELRGGGGGRGAPKPEICSPWSFTGNCFLDQGGKSQTPSSGFFLTSSTKVSSSHRREKVQTHT